MQCARLNRYGLLRSPAPMRGSSCTRSSPPISPPSRRSGPRSPAGAPPRGACSRPSSSFRRRRGSCCSSRATSRPRWRSVCPCSSCARRRRSWTRAMPGLSSEFSAGLRRSSVTWDGDSVTVPVDDGRSLRLAPASAASAPLRAGRRRMVRGGDPRGPPAHHRRHAGPVRAANGESRDSRRRGFPQGLLPRPGDRGARAVSRPGKAAHGSPSGAARARA